MGLELLLGSGGTRFIVVALCNMGVCYRASTVAAPEVYADQLLQ